ncbi:isocitrate/isopropylmalate dehydrogenase family protein [Ktedonosporobacter rubrisoli]|uniref:Isocitrate/isopropylmalate dehydrogenase family protein n=1 Tax=Ktedonosporobacter rubrisoli TaxID=2509675 RepID=A0A4P6K0V4_KTERU|nr:isocitrate/isopropylmalate family dehydrogenase [Ktedonosporobacter rubrisoli]QBD81605.1 isocitrate/isopropylmalate dehydrogenase family protein [Ktedonosporobacter rubrisoli]
MMRWSGQGNPTICVIAGDDSAPEVVLPTVEILRHLAPGLDFRPALSGREAQERYGETFPAETRAAIDSADCTLFGASGGPSRPILWYLRWGKETYVNIRPVRWFPGYNSPMRNPERIDYVIVRDNLEGMYPPREGNLAELAALPSSTGWWQAPPVEKVGAYSVRLCTDEQMRRVAVAACELAVQRQAQGYPGRVTLGAKYSIQPRTDGRFREIVRAAVSEYAGLTYQEFLIDDLARRLVAVPETLDVVVLNNEHGDILADAASGTIGGLGLSPSACYGEGYAYFEPVHGSAPDLAGKNVVNPTAMLLSGALMLDYFGYAEQAQALRDAVARVYREGAVLPVDQGGQASTTTFVEAVSTHL